jgi:hypothetical protein
MTPPSHAVDHRKPFVAGVYPLPQDESCFFLAVDFDKRGWRDDALTLERPCSLAATSARKSP